jgi:hypothetical protein
MLPTILRSEKKMQKRNKKKEKRKKGEQRQRKRVLKSYRPFSGEWSVEFLEFSKGLHSRTPRILATPPPPTTIAQFLSVVTIWY